MCTRVCPVRPRVRLDNELTMESESSTSPRRRVSINSETRDHQQNVDAYKQEARARAERRHQLRDEMRESEMNEDKVYPSNDNQLTGLTSIAWGHRQVKERHMQLVTEDPSDSPDPTPRGRSLSFKQRQCDIRCR